MQVILHNFSTTYLIRFRNTYPPIEFLDVILLQSIDSLSHGNGTKVIVVIYEVYDRASLLDSVHAFENCNDIDIGLGAAVMTYTACAHVHA